jgi:hypothetical protein
MRSSIIILEFILCFSYIFSDENLAGGFIPKNNEDLKNDIYFQKAIKALQNDKSNQGEQFIFLKAYSQIVNGMNYFIVYANLSKSGIYQLKTAEVSVPGQWVGNNNGPAIKSNSNINLSSLAKISKKYFSIQAFLDKTYPKLGITLLQAKGKSQVYNGDGYYIITVQATASKKETLILLENSGNWSQLWSSEKN